MFEAYPSYGRYRTLRLTDPQMRGEDVFALQTGLHTLGAQPGLADGILGPQTAAAIKRAQSTLAVTVDGLAGGQTQTALVRLLADRARTKYSLPVGLAFGQLSHESGCRVGNYSPQRSDGHYDAGVAQRNTKFTPARDGFTVPTSIEACGRNLRLYFDKYAGVEPFARRWGLAAAAWNAPAYANWIARDEGATSIAKQETLEPGHTARATLEQYIASTTAFMKL